MGVPEIVIYYTAHLFSIQVKCYLCVERKEVGRTALPRLGGKRAFIFPIRETSALHLTRRGDLLELNLAPPDLSLYQVPPPEHPDR